MPVTDRNDALRKIRSNSISEVTESVSLLLKDVQNDQVYAEVASVLWNYVWNKYANYNSQLAQRIVRDIGDAEWDQQIVLGHTDADLRLECAQGLASSSDYLRCSQDVKNTDDVVAARRVYLTRFQNEATQRNEAIVESRMSNPKFVEILKHHHSAGSYEAMEGSTRLTLNSEAASQFGDLLLDRPDRNDGKYVIKALNQFGVMNSELYLRPWSRNREAVKKRQPKEQAARIENDANMILSLLTIKLNQARDVTIERIATALSPEDFEGVLDRVKNSGVSREVMNDWNKVAFDWCLTHGKFDKVAQYAGALTMDDAPKYKRLMMSFASSPQYVEAILPYVKQFVDPGFFANLWQAAPSATRAILVRHLGNKWATSLLVRLAEEPDRLVAVEAMNVLSQMGQANLVRQRNPEI
jgi:hypothetical protein